MSRLTAEQQTGYSQSSGDPERQTAFPMTTRGGWRPSGWLLAGLAVAGLGVAAWYYLGPDLRRYMKIRNM